LHCKKNPFATENSCIVYDERLASERHYAYDVIEICVPNKKNEVRLMGLLL